MLAPAARLQTANPFSDPVPAAPAGARSGATAQPVDPFAAPVSAPAKKTAVESLVDEIRPDAAAPDEADIPADGKTPVALAAAYAARSEAKEKTFRFDSAINDVNHAIALNPANADYYNLRQSEKYLRDYTKVTIDYDDMLADLNHAVSLNPKNAMFLHNLCYMYKQAGRFDDTLRACQMAMDLDKGPTPQTIKPRALANYVLGRLDLALVDYQTLLKLDPKDDEAGFAICRIHLRRLELDAALEACQAAATTRPTDADLLKLLADVQAARHMWAEARDTLDRALATVPNAPDVLASRCLADNQLGQYPDAVTDCTHALAMLPDADVALQRAEAHRARHEIEDMLADDGLAISLKPGVGEYPLRRCEDLIQVNRARQAIADCDLALADNPRLADAFHLRAGINAQEGKIDAAIADESRAIAVNPAQATYWRNRGAFRQLAGKLEDALGDFNQALKLKPDYQLAQYGRDKVQAQIRGVAAEHAAQAQAAQQYADTHTQLHVCNNAGDEAFVAVAYSEGGKLKISGWWTVGDQACAVIGPLPRADLQAFAQAGSYSWSGDRPQCVRRDRFERLVSGSYSCSGKEYVAKFQQIAVSGGDTFYYLTGTQPGDSLPQAKSAARGAAQAAYDSCAGYWADYATKPDAKAMVSGFYKGSSGRTGCYYAWSQKDIAAAVKLASASCNADHHEACGVFAEGAGLVSWAESEWQSARDGRAPARYAGGGARSSGGGGFSLGGLLRGAVKVLGVVEFVAGMATGNEQMASQGMQGFAAASGDSGSGGGGGYVPSPQMPIQLGGVSNAGANLPGRMSAIDCQNLLAAAQKAKANSDMSGSLGHQGNDPNQMAAYNLYMNNYNAHCR